MIKALSACPARLALGTGTLVMLLAMMVMSAPADAAKYECGKASWYALYSKTASGEYANPGKMTAAHRTLPFGTKVKVTNLNNGRSVIVRINDRGPFIRGRTIDVTKAAARKLGFHNQGVTKVKVERLDGARFPQKTCA
jgi:rare lipoprotein A